MLSGIFIEVTSHAADHTAVVPLVTEDVVAIGYLDLSSVNVSALLNEARDWGLVPREELEHAMQVVEKIHSWFRELAGAGATRAYVLLRMSDLERAGPTWVLPLAEQADPEAMIQTLTDPLGGLPRPAFFPVHFRAVDGAVLAATSKEQLDRLVAARVERPRPEAVASLDALGAGDAGLVLLGDSDSRRVLREMFPRLPAPFDAIDGRMIADGLLWAGVGIDLPPEPQVRIRLETSGPHLAESLRQSADSAVELAKPQLMAWLGKASGLSEANAGQALELLRTTVDGAAVKLTLGDDAAAFARLRELLTPLASAAREPAQRQLRFNRFRQLAIAFIMYTDRHKAFVAQASYDQAGQPLLSWRVHLLPFLEQQELYAEFHLDEPWDSPHNRRLIDRMPEIYSDPSDEVRRAAGTGRTTFMAPVAADTLFPPRQAPQGGKPLTFRDVKDGTSKTILFVEVAPDRAVVWTKPDDWHVNFEDPWQGLRGTDRPGFVAAFCDAHVRFITSDMDAQRLRAMLTRAGGEVVD
jgi:hypothetical protein